MPKYQMSSGPCGPIFIIFQVCSFVLFFQNQSAAGNVMQLIKMKNVISGKFFAIM